MTPLTSERIKDQARTVGFDLCGIASVEAFPELSFLHEWLGRGYAGDMTWLAQSAELRSDVRRVLPGARSVIVTGTLYNTDRPSSVALPPGAGHVSRYAWGDDYHRVLWARHNELVQWMREVSPEPFESSALVDSGPVQERVYAQRSSPRCRSIPTPRGSSSAARARSASTHVRRARSSSPVCSTRPAACRT
jgi:epoxyqueuosine reductase